AALAPPGQAARHVDGERPGRLAGARGRAAAVPRATMSGPAVASLAAGPEEATGEPPPTSCYTRPGGSGARPRYGNGNNRTPQASPGHRPMPVPTGSPTGPTGAEGQPPTIGQGAMPGARRPPGAAPVRGRGARCLPAGG